jgi:hypothetical protein
VAQWADPERAARIRAGIHRMHQRKRARKALTPFAVPPSIAAPGVRLWAYLPPLRLSLSVSLQRAHGKRKPLL